MVVGNTNTSCEFHVAVVLYVVAASYVMGKADIPGSDVYILPYVFSWAQHFVPGVQVRYHHYNTFPPPKR